ncbi:MAG: hypothetical protein Q4E41_08565 [Bacteroidales bacterium]|nr:hypothetical protein [Bacteroidales bacterium]
MKKTILAITLILLATGAALDARAQRADAHIRAIEKKYSEAQQTIAMGDEEEMARNMATLHIDQMWPGSGRHKEDVTLYFTLDDNEEGYTNVLYLAKHTYNVAAMEYELEYLFDESGAPLKCHAKGPDGEYTFYFAEGKLHKTLPKKNPDEFFTNADSIKREASRIYRFFEAAIKQNH